MLFVNLNKTYDVLWFEHTQEPIIRIELPYKLDNLIPVSDLQNVITDYYSL